MTDSITTELPLAPGIWTLDQPHCTVEFTARHMGISKVRGRFHEFDATLTIGDALATSRLEASVELGSVDTRNPDRDAHLRSADFFDVESHPRMTFVSTSITATAAGSFEVGGDLTIAGTTQHEVFDVTFNGVETFPGDGAVHAGFEATSSVDRSDYGINFNVPLGAGGVVVSNKIGIELDIQLLAPST